jgi:GNAT superfamily N-acetyltransferase
MLSMSSTIGKRAASVRVGSLSNSYPNNRKKDAGSALLRTASTQSEFSESFSRDTENSSPFGVVTARPGEHVVARQLLAGVLRCPSPAEFQAQLDDPSYEATDRLFCKWNDLFVGHLRLARRRMRFGAAELPVTLLHDLLVLPEYRRQGCGTALLGEAEKQLRDHASLIGILRTNQPQYFLQRGWCCWSRHSFSMAGAREILSRLLQQNSDDQDQKRPVSRYNIRLWRHIELESLMQLYERRAAHSYGSLIRTEAHWQWLLGRHAFDRIYVAIEGPDRLELEGAPPIVGYAVMKEGRIVELMHDADHPAAAPQLLGRACSDAIEQDAHYVRFDAPVGDPLHDVIARAGGELGYHESVNGEVCLIKLLDVHRLIELIGDQLAQRARDAGLNLPLELGLHIDGARYTLEVRSRSAKIKPGRSCRSYLELSSADLTQLLLGHLDVHVAVAAQRIAAATRVAVELACVLFPKLPLWRPPWDELPAA